MKRIFMVLFCLFLFVLMVSCATDPTLPSETIETPPTTSGEPSVPSGPSTPETSIPSEPSEPTEPSEPETTIPEIPEEPSTGPTLEEVWLRRWEECPEATEIWLIMKEFGWSDAACAGILGNIMREVGGNTLKHIDHTLYNGSKTHFGLCQWAKRYYPDIWPTDDHIPSVREQMEFLRMTIQEYNGHGFAYHFSEEYLFTATDPAEVAYTFCKGYERPSEEPDKRMTLALEAYEYFTSVK
jgi:hypothetical protein